MAKKTYTAFDVETTGFARFEGDRIFSYVITDWEGNSKVYDVPLENWESHPNWIYLQEYFNDTSIVKIGHNIRFDIGFARANGIVVPDGTEIHDTMIMSQILQNLANSHALDVLAEQLYKYKAPIDNEVEKYARKLRSKFKRENPGSRINLSQYHNVPKTIMHPYQIADGERTILLARAMIPRLKALPAMWMDYQNEMEFIMTAIRQEEYGMFISWRNTNKILSWINEELDAAKTEFHKHCKREVNPNSGKQLVKYLTEDLGIKLTKTTDSGNLSADKDEIYRLWQQYKYPELEAILKIKAYEKGKSNLESYKELSHPQTRIIHFSKNTNPACTGRQSVSNPNLQNMATEVSNNAIYRIPARRCFVCRPGSIMLYVDYSGIELRLIAALANELEFINAFKNKTDPHGMTAPVLYGDNWTEVLAMIQNEEANARMKWVLDHNKGPAVAAHELHALGAPKWMYTLTTPDRYNYDFSTLKSQMRTGTKVFNFGIGYGGSISAVTLELIGLDAQQKVKGYDAYRKRWPNIAYFTANIIRAIKECGYVTTAFGRRLYVSRSQAYTGSNYIVQGTAAGILKRAENRTDSYCKIVLQDVMRIIVSIHDEMNLNMPKTLLKDQHYILSDISTLMTTFSEISVPLEVEWKYTSTNWAEKKKLQIITPDDYEFGKYELR